MSAMMTKIDTVANNISNVNTTGFKRERVDFNSLIYETLRPTNLDPVNMTGRPVNLQVGHGVRAAATTRMFTQGALQRTDRPMDFSIEGNGFFQVRRDEDTYFFTRDGSFHLMPLADGTLVLTMASGYPVISVDGDVIIFDEGTIDRDIVVSPEGNIFVLGEEGLLEDMDMQIQLVQFSNPNGLEAIGGNLFRETTASGEPVQEIDDVVMRPSRLVQGYLELSNVQIAEEMIGLITAQRAFDTNSRAISTSDEMLQTAVNLRR